MGKNNQVAAKETHNIGSSPTGAPLIVAIDTETHLITDTDPAPSVVCLSWAFRQRLLKSGLVVERGQIELWLRVHLTLVIQGQIKLVGHNLAYDAACICRTWPSLEELVFEAYEKDGLTCTKIREQLLDISEGCFRTAVDDEGNKTKTGYGLAELARKNLGKELKKDETPWGLSPATNRPALPVNDKRSEG